MLGSFTTKRLRASAGVQKNRSVQTVRRFLHSSGYHFFHSRKKGLLTQNDLRLRLKFARKAKRLPSEENLWREGIAFYLHGVGFQHKYNPYDEAKSTKTMAWRKRDEGLKPNCTAKGSHVGSGGKVAHFIVAIAYNKGVILCEQYQGKVNGEMFANFVLEHFERTFKCSANPSGKLFLQDGDPNQNSKKAKVALDAVGTRLFSIPPRSSDMKPIENVFNYTKEILRQQAIDQNITFENMEKYQIGGLRGITLLLIGISILFSNSVDYSHLLMLCLCFSFYLSKQIYMLSTLYLYSVCFVFIFFQIIC